MAHVKLFLSNVDRQSREAYKFLYKNRILASTYEIENEKDKQEFVKYNIKVTPTLIYGEHRFEGLNQIELSDL